MWTQLNIVQTIFILKRQTILQLFEEEKLEGTQVKTAL